MSRGRLLVLGDSLAFHGPEYALPADDPRLWPNIAAAGLDREAELVAGFGWTARHGWWALTGDPRVWSLLPRTDALVLALGSMDTLPSPLPTYLREGLRHLRPTPVRRFARARYQAAQPHLARFLRGRPVALPPHLTVSYLDRCLQAVRTIRPGLPVIGMLPSVHNSPEYGHIHTGHTRAVAALRTWSARTRVPLLDLPALVRAHIFDGDGNPDGMHWGFSAHAEVGTAVADLLRPMLP
ncbi:MULTISPECIES: diglucosylglycerate octanoyltransferase [unclassified Crossiella]|uniref:diglucosylglycerate octanoyltransferase n=1 Tax=unclassified Crossiella TaxID=2620835 RepID=UPI0020002AC3|nr:MULTISPECIES: diglucosylglycerate octanoyltransferase [unclassified Crossiella]MCK2241116.1 SGNH/GDSL hydrolase family protein [Crossiella sp. S99.2]MCK2253740.1 SGNH/GDSL hydrolase family protein [Crossiella sp. S99.1]